MGGNAGKSPRQGTGWGVDERHKGGLQVRIPWNPGVTDLKQVKHEFGKRAPGSDIQKEVQAGRMVAIGTTWEAEQMGVHCSPFGVIPKKGKAGRWRLIVDLSSPEGRSVNDGIDKELATVAYMSVDDAMAEVLRICDLQKWTYSKHIETCQSTH